MITEPPSYPPLTPASLQNSMSVEKTPAADAEIDKVTDNTKKHDSNGTSQRGFIKRMFKPPAPPPASMDDQRVTPEASAHFLSQLVFWWLNDLMLLGWKRTLEETDMYKLDPSREAAYLSNKLEASWQRRTEAAKRYNQRLEDGLEAPSLVTWIRWIFLSPTKLKARRDNWKTEARKHPSLVWATNDVVKWWFWSAAVFRISSDCLQTTSPLLMRRLVNWLSHSYYAHKSHTPAPSVGQGVGMAVGIFAMQFVASIGTAQFFYRGASSGVMVRGALIVSLYKRAVAYTGKSRSILTDSRLVSHMSTDISRIDWASNYYMGCFAAPIQLALCLALLIVNLGPSALAGFAIFMLFFPLQNRVTKYLFSIRKKCTTWTDQRTRMISEIVTGIRVLKFFAWEQPYLQKLATVRKKELSFVRRILVARAGNISVAFALPVISAVVAFIVYKATGHDLDSGIIFSSLSLFQLLRQPLMLLPQAFNAATDAKAAFTRLQVAFEAETTDSVLDIDHDAPFGLLVENASFCWDALAPPTDTINKSKHKKDATRANAEERQVSVEPFSLLNIDFQVERGSTVAIVGSVGSGKSSLLEGLIGNMRKTRGSVTFGGKVAYAAQIPMCFNATIRDNICFGQAFDEARYTQCLHDASLERDLDIFEFGDMTEIGERGITLSGGQKQRISIARALYYNADVVILDDCFSALDAQVAREIFDNAIQGALKDKTVILVTHALHLLAQVDYIYTIAKGQILERGTYSDLLAKHGAFSKLVTEFGGSRHETETETEAETGAEIANTRKETKPEEARGQVATVSKPLMSKEERSTGSVDWRVYKGYLKHGNGKLYLPLLAIAIVLMQGSSVLSSYWLVFWQEEQFNITTGAYMGLYAAISVCSAITVFVMGTCFSEMAIHASASLHDDTVHAVIFSPLSFFDSTPMGRILSRMTKDIETVDNQLSDTIRMFILMFSNVVGGVILITIVQHYFIIPLVVIAFGYFGLYRFYAASAREIKRVEALLRSLLYAHFSETLNGINTIKAYGRVPAFCERNAKLLDNENRAYILTSSTQRWVAIRLDFMSSTLTLIVGLIAVAERERITPASLGIALVYILTMQQGFSFIVRQFTMAEQNMNSVERLLHYAEGLEQEAAYESHNEDLSPQWPQHGSIEFKSVQMRYRPGLPLILKGVSFSVKPGESVGVCGRTGAGKSTVMLTLLRMIEACGGSIEIDGVDISKIGLKTLRSAVSIIPQDAILFQGTLRSNLDPFSVYDDRLLNDALRRSYLLESARTTSFSLDMHIEDGGSNLSVGERALVSLARALVRNTKIILLDEATASIDFETDSKIQETIKTEFADRTLLCIAHRLRTIIGYDKILILHHGEVQEFDTPQNLYNKDGLFKAMCDSNAITEKDIIAARAKTM